MDKKLIVSVSPHIRSKISTKRIMYSVILALMPALFGSLYFFGTRALCLTLISCASALVMEALFEWITHRPITITDGSALLTGVLLAFNLPATVPYWLPAAGSAFGILIGKQVFGGLGYNIFNPALVGRTFLMASWPSFMTGRWISPLHGSISGTIIPGGASRNLIDALSTATPLNTVKLHSGVSGIVPILNSKHTIFNLFLGNTGGCIGETSSLLLLTGAIFLFSMRYIDYRIPLSYILTVGCLTAIFYPLGITKVNPLFHLFSGGLFLGAFFMATDYVTTPVTPKGRWIFGILCGVITVLIRIWGGYPEGVSYSILLMNGATPLIDRFTRPKKFGT
jgi:electron transport complex protein RnfD